MSTKIRGRKAEKSDRVVISSSASFTEFPRDKIVKFLENIGSKHIEQLPFGMTVLFDEIDDKNDIKDKDKMIFDGLMSFHLNVLNQNGQAVADYLGRLDKINNFMKPYASKSSLKTDRVNIRISGEKPGYLVQPALDSFNQSEFASLIFEADTNKRNGMTDFGKKVYEYSTNRGLVLEFAYRADKGLFDLKNQKFEDKTYNLTVMVKKNSEH